MIIYKASPTNSKTELYVTIKLLGLSVIKIINKIANHL